MHSSEHKFVVRFVLDASPPPIDIPSDLPISSKPTRPPSTSSTMGKQARQRKEKSENTIKLAQPDRSGPSEKTLLELAQERNLFAQAENDPRNKNRVKKADDDDEDDDGLMSPTAERVLDTMLWVVSLTMVHFTFDYLVQYQYGMDMDIPAVATRTGRAFLREHLLLPF